MAKEAVELTRRSELASSLHSRGELVDEFDQLVKGRRFRGSEACRALHIVHRTARHRAEEQKTCVDHRADRPNDERGPKRPRRIEEGMSIPSLATSSQSATTMTTSPAFPPLVQVSMVKVVTPSSAPARLPLPSSVNSLLSPRPSSASSSRSTSPAPAQKRKRVDQPSKPKKRPAEKRIKELDVVTTPPSRSASPFTRPKAVPRSVAAPAPDLPVEHIDAARVVRESPKGYEPCAPAFDPSRADDDPRAVLTDLKDPSRTALEWAGSEIPQVELEYPVVGVRETFVPFRHLQVETDARAASRSFSQSPSKAIA